VDFDFERLRRGPRYYWDGLDIICISLVLLPRLIHSKHVGLSLSISLYLLLRAFHDSTEIQDQPLHAMLHSEHECTAVCSDVIATRKIAGPALVKAMISMSLFPFMYAALRHE